MKKPTPDTFQKTILTWYKKHGRHSLLWRKTRDPYRIFISELMLQQTQVDRVIPKYERFLKKFPDIQSLAEAPFRSVLQEWKGLGYNRRALYAKRTAEKILHAFHGIFPKNIVEIKSLPGIGSYTAHAIAAFTWNTPAIFIETNIRRVFIYFFFPDKKSVSDADIMPLIQKMLWHENPRRWYWALMDYGALELKKMPNPNKKSAHYVKQSKFEGSTRYARSHILERIIYKNKASLNDLLLFFSDDPHMKPFCSPDILLRILKTMEKEGLLYMRENTWRIAPL